MKTLKKKSGDPRVRGLLKRLDKKPSSGMNAKQYEAMLNNQVASGKISKEEKEELLNKFKVSSDIDKAYPDTFNLLNRYEEGGPVAKDVYSLLAALGEVKTPEDYTDAEFEEVRGRAKMGDLQVRKPSGGALDRDTAQPMEFEVRKYGSDSPSRSYERFELRGVELGGVDEETGMMRPNVLILPPEIYDMIEDGTIERKDIQQALGQSYSRSDDQGRRTMPLFLRGEEDDPRQPGTPGKGKIKIKKRREFTLPQLPYMTSPKYAGGRRPLFTPGQLGRAGRGA